MVCIIRYLEDKWTKIRVLGCAHATDQPEQNRTEQNRTEQNITEQNRTEQNRTEQNRRVA
jgi:hypothetical protein